MAVKKESVLTANNIGAQEYLAFCQFLEHQCGIVLGDNKQYLVRSRLSPLIAKFNIDSLSALTVKATGNRDVQLRNAVINAMTTNETLWFRDTYPFDILQNTLLPTFTAQRTPLRIWSAACSSGQEAYSIAMSIAEYKLHHRGAFPGGVQIVGTDISSDMIEQCEAAQYDSLSLARGLSEQRKSQFFESFTASNSDHRSRLKMEIRNMVTFMPINLLDSFSKMGKFDIIYCRNVLIYFSVDSKQKILQKIAACLPPEGALFVGASESLSGISTQFSMQRCNPGLYYTKKIQ
ncbi:MAG: chemotaxis protein methyltransferase CheR [Paraglaciecola sp.]